MTEQVRLIRSQLVVSDLLRNELRPDVLSKFASSSGVRVGKDVVCQVPEIRRWEVAQRKYDEDVRAGRVDPTNVIVAMTIYSVALLVRAVADALGSVSSATRQAATAMGYTALGRFLAVDLPLAVPVLAAGLRVTAVSNVSIVSVSSLVGISQLGFYLTDGYDRSFATEVWVGIVASVLLALVFDLVILAASRALTPWTRAAA